MTHEFSDVSFGGGGGYRVNGGSISAASTPTALVMAPSGSGSRAVNHFGGVDNRDSNPGSQDRPRPIRNGDEDDPTNNAVDCFRVTGLTGLVGTYESINRSLGEATAAGSGSFTQPEHCARLIADGVYDYVSETGGKTTVHWRNYLNGYRVHINPTASVVWGGSSVSWSSLDDDPFDGLTCPSQTFEVVDMVDICQDFKDEVDEYWGNGIGSGGDFRIEYVGSGAGPSARFNNIVIRNKADSDSGDRTFQDVYRPSGARHAHLWLVDSTPLSTSAGIDGTRPDEDLYLTQETRGARHGRTAADYGTDNWTPLMSVHMFDGDNDPKYGDFGKTDFPDGNTPPEGVAKVLLERRRRRLRREDDLRPERHLHPHQGHRCLHPHHRAEHHLHLGRGRRPAASRYRYLRHHHRQSPREQLHRVQPLLTTP